MKTTDTPDTRDWYTLSRHLYTGKTTISMQNYTLPLLPLILISYWALFAVLGLFFTMSTSSIYAQIEITTDKNISSPKFNGTISEDAEPKPDILYSALHSDTIVGEVLNNFTYPIEAVRITASVYDKNGVIAATGDSYTSEYWIKPGSRSGFDIYLDKKLPSNSKYTLTTSLEKSENDKPEALQLSVGGNSKGSNNFKLLGEVLNQGQDDANSVKVSGIFYDKNHKVIDADYTYANPDIISPNKKAPFELSFYTDNPEKIKSIAINAQSNEYSLITNGTQNNTKSEPSN
jgi:hypothetical protein